MPSAEEVRVCVEAFAFEDAVVAVAVGCKVSVSVSAVVEGAEGGTFIHTTHHPLPVLLVRSTSVLRFLTLARVFKIWLCTFMASMRVHPGTAGSILVVEKMPSAAGVPGSGMLGMLVCTVRRLGS